MLSSVEYKAYSFHISISVIVRCHICILYIYIFQKMCRQMHFSFEILNITVTPYTTVDILFAYICMEPEFREFKFIDRQYSRTHTSSPV